MPTTTVKTVKSAGGDYTSLSGWEAGQQADLTASDTIQQADCYSMNDTAICTISGWTTDATRYIYIRTPSTERHAGVWNTSKYRLTNASSAFSGVLVVSEEFVRVEGLQFENTTGSSPTVQITGTANAASSDIRFDTCLVRKGGKTGNGQFYCNSGKTNLRNTAIYQSTDASLLASTNANAPTVNADNCTFASATTYGVNAGSGVTVTLRNCYSGGNTTDAYTGTITRTTCAHDTATSFSGSTGSVTYATGSGAKFTNITANSEDYHLTSGSALIDAGTDLSGTFTNDFDGETRTAPFDIGADELVSAGGASSVELVSSGRLVGGSRLVGGVLVGA